MSEQAAWTEINRLEAENDRLRARVEQLEAREKTAARLLKEADWQWDWGAAKSDWYESYHSWLRGLKNTGE